MNVHHGPLELASSRRARNRRLGAVLAVFALVSTALGTFAREPAPAAAPLSAGMVSINFDDGLRSQWTLAHQQMLSRGLVGTYYLVSGPIQRGDACCLTTANVRTLQSEGNELGAHGGEHLDLTTLSPAALDTEILAAKSWITSTFGVVPTTFATPYGASNPTVRARLRTFYPAVRSISPALADATSYVDDLPAIDVHAGITVASVKALIDRAIAERRWAILTFHDIVASGASTGTTYNVADFAAILDYVKARNVQVVTNSQGVARLEGRVTPVVAGVKAVYDDQLVNGFTDWSWAARQLDQSRLVHAGTNAIEANLSSWAGLYFHTPGVAVAATDSLELWVNGGPSGGQTFRITLQRNGALLGQVSSTAVLGRTVPANAWTRLSIPLSTFGVGAGTVTEVSIEDTTGGVQPLLSFDDIRFVAAGVPVTTTTLAPTTVPPTTVPPTTTTVVGGASVPVYGDALQSGFADWSWAARNLAATSPVLGTRSIVWEPDGWTGIYLHADQVATPTGRLRFSMHGGTTGGQAITVSVGIGGVVRASANVATLGGAIPANAWRTYELAVPTGIPAGAAVDLVWQDASGANQSAVALDAISLEPAGAPVTTTVPPATTTSTLVPTTTTTPAPVTTTTTIPVTTTMPATTTTAVPSATRVVYDDALVDTDDWGWATRNFASTSPVQSGARAIAVSADPWTGLQLHLRTPYAVGATSRFGFWINGEATGGQAIVVQLFSNGTLRGTVPVSTLLGGPIPANQWRQVTLPLASLGITNGTITEMVFYANAGTAGGRYSLDALAFTS